MTNQLPRNMKPILIRFGVRDIPRYLPLARALSEVPDGQKNQAAKELMLAGLKYSNFLELYGIKIDKKTLDVIETDANPANVIDNSSQNTQNSNNTHHDKEYKKTERRATKDLV